MLRHLLGEIQMLTARKIRWLAQLESQLISRGDGI